MPDQDIPEYGAVIAITKSGHIALQLRDNNPRIADPNCLSLFAGRLHAQETPQAGALREFKEETTIVLKPEQLEYLMTYETDVARYGRIAHSHVFVARNIDPAQITIREGQGYRLINGPQDLERYDFALISKEILLAYFASLSK